MDAYEATRVVFSRIQALLDPDNAAKIMGLLLIQDHGEKEMIRLAFGPEALLHSVILKARKDLGLLPQLPSAAVAAAATSAPFPRHENSTPSCFSVAPPPPLSISSPSWAPPPPLGEGPIQCSSSSDEELTSPAHRYVGSFGVNDQHQLSPFFSNPYVNGPGHHRRSCSAAPDLCVASPTAVDGSTFGWKPCLYFSRGFCKNGTSCRFVHELLPSEDGSFSKLEAAAATTEQELMLRSKRLQQHAVFPYSPTPVSPSSSKYMNFLLLQQQQQLLQLQNESQRAVAVAAATVVGGGDEGYVRFMGRSRSDFTGIVNPGSRQIYLTFPAESTFREEDVSNYFSIYGPVQDVRIPYQQKRMFGFVTFVYPETVKLILAKGNPHSVCDARVLVKPYKEKGKVQADRKQQGERGDAQFFPACTTPTAGLDSRDPFDFQQLGPRMMHNNSNSCSQEMILRRKWEEQQQAAELQQAIELQGRRFMGLQLFDFKNRSMPSSSASIRSPTTTTTASSNERSHEGSPTEDKSRSPASTGGEQRRVKAAVGASDEEESAPNEDGDFQESLEHNLPDSPFASPTKLAASLVEDPFSDQAAVEPEFGHAISSNGNHLIGSTLLPPTSSLDMASFKSCFFQMPRFSSGHGAVGL